MTDGDLRRALDETMMGAAAIGVCIARTLAESDPTFPQRLAVRGQKLFQHLCDKGHGDAARALFSFYGALNDPAKFPLLTPEETGERGAAQK